ncbi:two-component sensor histidine kinase [Pukyongia salina]|uniref:histidine kinase n=1 Tax=Pukyongia salina TaxID=2094025 RepID=A0A2S0I066_9FLAO|nr:HAMP domain-containing sensor histidine kinase [Pukyongia salina]AVI51813.1 two-component sensor histidine kinase [Pukyongia salina]
MYRNRNLYIVLFAAAIIGLFIIQYQYLRIGLNLARVQFGENIALSSEVITEDLSTENQLSFLVLQSLKKDDSFFKLSVDSIQEASRHFLSDFIQSRLVANGIEKEFDYSLFTKDSTYYLESPVKLKPDPTIVRYPIELKGYLPLALNKQLILELHFKDLNRYFLSQLNGMVIPSLVFIVIIILVIIWIMKSYLSQRSLIISTNEFINNFTHELKTPVFSISLASGILEKDIEAKHKPVFSIIKLQVERLRRHIDKILELSMIESKKQLFQMEQLDFRPLLVKVCEEYKALVQLEEVEFNFTIEEAEFKLKGVGSHLENAILNLLDNSKKYSNNPEIRLSAQKEGKHLTIKINDNGWGINPKDVQRIFKKYVRVIPDNMQNVSGYGLGLSYVQEVLKRHKGKIEVNSEVGRGTDVIIKLPLINE